MKLKLETTGKSTLLNISESITAENIPVLKAGLIKMRDSDQDPVILDLSSLAAKDIEPYTALPALDQICRWADENEFEVVVVSAIQNFGDVSTRDQAVTVLDSPMGDLLFDEVLLKAEARYLKGRKAILETRLGKLITEEQKTRALRQDHARLFNAVTTLEKQVSRAIKKRKNDPVPQAPIAEKIDRLVPPILVQQGIIPAPGASK